MSVISPLGCSHVHLLIFLCKHCHDNNFIPSFVSVESVSSSVLVSSSPA